MAIAQVGIPGSFCDTSGSINRVWQMRLTGEVRPADCAAGLVKSLMAAVGESAGHPTAELVEPIGVERTDSRPVAESTATLLFGWSEI